MLEVLVNGLHAGKPYHVAGAGVVVRLDGATVLETSQSFSREEVESRTAAEVAAIVLALEKLLEDHWHGDSVLVRTVLSDPSSLPLLRARRLRPDLQHWIERLCELGEQFEISATTSPAKVVQPALTLALQAVLNRATRDRADVGRCASCRKVTPRSGVGEGA